MRYVVQKSSVLAASRQEIYQKLQDISILQYIAKPYMTFQTKNLSQSARWEKGQIFSLNCYLFGIIPLGEHVIDIKQFSETMIDSHEYNKCVPYWHHQITLREVDEKHCLYTDWIEIEAGWKTAIIGWWAKRFYAHRQRKWRTLL